ncbi:RNA polymerase factor sigma-54 [Paenibacillus sp. N3.4]|nr:RNA polymerase factor sigma-54 [Paenibacillus sp. N3.4]
MLNLSPTILLQQSQSLAISPKILQSIHVLQLSSVDLVSYLQEQSSENPLLDVIWTDNISSRRTKNKLNRVSSNTVVSLLELTANLEDTLEMMLVSQLRLANHSDRQYKIAKFLAGNLSENGYLTITPKEAAQCLHVSEEEVTEALAKVQALEPAGIAARTLQECLEIQIRRDENADPYAEKLVSCYLYELGAGKWKYLDRELNIPLDRIKQSLAYIRTLNPKPGLAYKHQQNSDIKPDAVIQKFLNRYIVSLNQAGIPKVSLNKQVQQLILESGSKEAEEYMKKHVQTAMGLIQSLEDRQHTLFRVLEAITEEQMMFMDKGSFFLKPLNLKTIAERLQLHESTVSRAIQNKVVQTPQGIYELKFFFAKGPSTTGGEAASAERIKCRIQELIDGENKSKPLSDQQLTEIMNKENLPISRRTVMKYREEMNILSSRLRG